MRRIIATFATLVLMNGLAFAHPGHGPVETQNLPSHYFTEPVHALMWIVLLVAAGVAAKLAYAGRLPRWR